MAKYKVATFQGLLIGDLEQEINRFLDFEGRVLVNVSITTEVDPEPVDEEIPNMYTVIVAYSEQD